MQISPMPIFSRARAAVMLVLLSAGLLGMGGRVAYLQTVARQHTLSWVERQQYQREPLSARRGTIFDRNLIVMACTVQKQRLYADPRFFYDSFHGKLNLPEEILKKRTPAEGRRLMKALGRIIDQDGENLFDEMCARSTDPRHPHYFIVADDLDDRAAAEVEKLNIPGIGLEPTSKRYYPLGSLASHIVGTSGKDDLGTGTRGLEGIELSFNELLAGKDGWKVAIKNAQRRAVGVADEDYLPPQHGQHLVLTIDTNIQMIAEQELAAGCERVKAKGGVCIVMDPRSGDMLALANYPTFNPDNVMAQEAEIAEEIASATGNPQRLAEAKKRLAEFRSRRRNQAITDPRECGSVIKPFHAGPALAWKVTRPEEIWSIPGITWVTPYGRRVTDVHGYGKLCTWDGLVKSSNIFAAMLANRMGNARLYQAFSSFGFGRKTGIDLPGEDEGRLNPLRRWNRYTTESVAQGYEIMLTPLQLARGFCVFGNGGYLVPARIIKGQLDPEGKVVTNRDPTRLELLPQVIDRPSADLMKRILADVPVRGTAANRGDLLKSGRSRYWNIFGKTGTAHISEGRSGYSAHRYNSSFLCGAPMESPRIVVAMVIYEPDPRIAHYGGAVSAPPARNVVERTLAYMQVPPSPDLTPPPAHIASVLFNFQPSAYKRPPDPADRPARGAGRNATASARP